ncbi:MAG TPA: DUF2283 domain-containing protein [Planctomycetota bacterium]|nr:DUF2283 domain-containing protein [Planctomycetota bacterium]
MKFDYCRETDSLYIDLNANVASDTIEIADGFLVDLDEKGNVVGLDIEYASKKLDLTTVDVEALPIPVPAAV